MTELADRFLGEIRERIEASRIAALYLFPPLRQGAVETGVAVLALHPDADVPVVDDSVVMVDEQAAGPAEPPEAVVDENATGSRWRAELPGRHAIVTARYCATLKGADRGKWEFGMVVEADAPLETLESVVRGVQRRMGDDAEPLRLSGDAVRAAGLDAPWSTTI